MPSLARTTAAVFLALCSFDSVAHADILLTASRTSEFYIPAGPGVLAPLDDDGSAQLDFVTTKKGPVAIIYNAECAATGNGDDWIGLEIYVDDKLANPKAAVDDFALCAATSGTEIYTAVSRRAFVKLNEGTHTVRVLVSRQGVLTGRLDDTSLVIKD